MVHDEEAIYILGLRNLKGKKKTGRFEEGFGVERLLTNVHALFEAIFLFVSS